MLKYSFNFVSSFDRRLFLGICDADKIRQILANQNKHDRQPICAMRFGSVRRMEDVKAINIRIDLATSKYFVKKNSEGNNILFKILR